MNQKKSKSRFTQIPYLCKSVYVMMILCSCLLMIPASVMAEDGTNVSMNIDQQIAVTGRVIDHTGEAVIGASVMVEGTTLGTITDIDGNFSLSAPQNGTLVISFVGYETQKVRVRAGGITITLKEDAELLDEVVVVGYGAVKRANLTGAVSSVDMAGLSDIPSTNLTSVLMGTMPGVTVGESTGNPLSDATIKIRINGSWNSEDPLYVIDGFIRDAAAFNMLDPSEVENISVLKDAAAAIYGVRGAGGVLLVTTKRGKEGKTKINYSGSYGFSQGVSMPEMLSAYEQGVMLNDMWNQEIKYASSTSEYSFFTDSELEKMKGLNYDWLDMGWKNSSNTRHTLNISGGTEKVRYFVGGSYMWSDGNFSNLDINRYSFRTGVDVDFTKQFKGNFSVSFSGKDSNMPLNEKDAEPDRMYGTFSDLARAPRFVPAYSEDGLPVGNGIAQSGTHPLEVFNSGSYKKNNSTDIALSGNLSYDFTKIKGLRADISINYSRNSNYSKQLAKSYKLYEFEKDGNLITNQLKSVKTITNSDKIYESAGFGYAYQLNPSLSYANRFGDHDISVMAVYEQSESGGNNLSLGRTGMVIENLESMGGFSQDQKNWNTNSTINTKSRRQSFIGRVNYNYANKYFFEGAARYEASTNFAPGHRWGLFPSVAVGWRISEENFFKENVTFMDNLKLRVSYGRLGSDKVSMGQWRESYSLSTKYALFGNNILQTGLSPAMEGLVYWSSTWEKSDSYNAGIDMRFFNCLNVSIDGFYRHTFDILDDGKSEFPQTSGISGSTPKTNYGIQDSWGGELEITYQKQVNKDWGIIVKGNLAYATNKVIRKRQNPGVIGTWSDEEGKIRNGDTGYICMGIARTQEDVDNYIAYLRSHLSDPNDENVLVSVFGRTQDTFAPGMLMFKDIGSPRYQDENGNWHDGAPDGHISDDNYSDQRIINKYSSAPFNYGFTLGFNYKSFRVDALFNGEFGHDVIFDKGFYETASGGKRSGDFLSLESNNLKEWYGNYWTEDNPNAKYPRLDSHSLRNKRSTFWMRDGHSLRLRSLNISYNLPKKYANELHMEQLRVFFTGTNLWTIVNPYPYKDAYVGFWSDYPQIRTFNFGVNLTF